MIANQPRYLGGVLDTASSRKGARFVSKCNQFRIPLLVLVDTPGFMPGTKQETEGVIRFGAGLVHAFAEATVPRITVILRKAFGGAFITMNSKDLGADYVFAWPQAEIGVMGAKPAVGIIHRRELAAAEDPDETRDRLAASYAEAQLRPQVAASTGYVDELITPAQTRQRVSWAFRSLGGPRDPEADDPPHGRNRLRRDGAARALPRAWRPRSRRARPRAYRRGRARAHGDGAREPVRRAPRPRYAGRVGPSLAS